MSPLLPTLFFVTLLANIATPIYGLNPRKLQEGPVPGSPDTEVKCGGCPCNNPCSQSPPPPPPPSPPPPPKKPPTPSIYCPPPPSYIYITGPPGSLYPVDPYYSGATRSLVVGLPILLVCGFLGQLAICELIFACT